MGNLRCLRLHLIFASFFLVAMTYTCLGSPNISGGCSKMERRTLLKFKRTIKDYTGMLSSWVGDDCCRWRGVRCDDATGRSHVVGLSLEGNNDHADKPTFPSDLLPVEPDFISTRNNDAFNSSIAELRRLKYLNFLDLSGNDFQGDIPELIGSLKELTHLNLSNPGFSYGYIPHHIGNLSRLKVLDLSIPYTLEMKANDMAWVSGLSSLQHLDLTQVDLSGARNRGMVLYKIPSLIELRLGDCGVTIADLAAHYDLSVTLPNLQHLDLSQKLIKLLKAYKRFDDYLR